MFKGGAIGSAANKGFTLVELLIVIAIIGMLAAIAVPSFLGQREKAKIKSMQASAKGAVAEVQYFLDAQVTGNPVLALTAAGLEACYEPTYPSRNATCASVYNMAVDPSRHTDNVEDIIQIIVAHHKGKNDMSLYVLQQYLFSSVDPTAGTVVLVNSGPRSIRMTAYGDSTTAVLFNTVIGAR